MTTQEEFFQQHAVDGQLTDAQMAELILLPAEGDSGTTHVVRNAGEPDPAGTKAAAPAPAGDGGSKDGEGTGTPNGDGKTGQQPTEAELNADNAVILAKDGKHTIPFDRLEEARERAREAAEAQATAERRTQELLAELEALRAAQGAAGTPAAPAPAGAPATAPAPGAPAIDADALREGIDFGDYSDEAIARATAQMVAKGQAALLAQIEALKASAGAPAAAPALDPVAAHYAAIREAHPDADSIAESTEFKAWKDAQPGIVKRAVEAALAGGSTQDVIETFASYKAATGKTGAAPAPQGKDAAAAAQAVIDATKPRTPTSLSEVPAGSAAHHDPAQAMLEKSGVELMRGFEGKSPEEIMATMSKIL